MCIDVHISLSILNNRMYVLHEGVTLKARPDNRVFTPRETISGSPSPSWFGAERVWQFSPQAIRRVANTDNHFAVGKGRQCNSSVGRLHCASYGSFAPFSESNQLDNRSALTSNEVAL